MPGKYIDAEMARLKREIKALEASIAPPNPPLQRQGIAEVLAKIADLFRQLKELEARLKHESQSGWS